MTAGPGPVRGASTVLERPVPALPELRLVGHLDAAAGEERGLPPHRHDALEVCCVHRGHLRWWSNDRWHTVAGGDIVVTPPGAPHGGDRTSLSACTLTWFQVVLSDRPRPLGLPAIEAAALVSALHALRDGPRPAPAGTPEAFRRLFELCQAGDQLASAEARGVIIGLLATIARAGEAEAVRAEPPVVAGARALMTEHVADPLALETIAARLGYSLASFKRAFRASGGIGPGEFYLRLRIEEACRRLATTDATVTGIAHDLGFASSQHFATIFRRIVGVSPGRYRAEPDGWPALTDDAPVTW